MKNTDISPEMPHELAGELRVMLEGDDVELPPDEDDGSGMPSALPRHPGMSDEDPEESGNYLPSASEMRGKMVSIIHKPRVEVYDLFSPMDRERYNEDTSLFLQADGLMKSTIMKGPDIITTPDGAIHVILVIEYKTVTQVKIVDNLKYEEMTMEEVKAKFFKNMPDRPTVIKGNFDKK
jgi:hypothetical protein